MTDKQPEALRLADVAHRFGLGKDVAVELRRLHEVNDALVQALQTVMLWIENWEPEFSFDPDWSFDKDKANAALAKAEGE